jgi:hypothetical protein
MDADVGREGPVVLGWKLLGFYWERVCTESLEEVETKGKGTRFAGEKVGWWVYIHAPAISAISIDFAPTPPVISRLTRMLLSMGNRTSGGAHWHCTAHQASS